MAAMLVKEILMKPWLKQGFDLSLLAKQNIRFHITALEVHPKHPRFSQLLQALKIMLDPHLFLLRQSNIQSLGSRLLLGW